MSSVEGEVEENGYGYLSMKPLIDETRQMFDERRGMRYR